MNTKSLSSRAITALNQSASPEAGNTIVTRQAAAWEVARMPAHVLWFYQRGQPVVLWLSSLRITLMPGSVRVGEVIVLIRN